MPSTSPLSSIQRTFRDLSDEEVADIEKAALLSRFGWSGGLGWEEVLKSWRVLIVSEAGAGKTHECQAQCKRLRAAGEAAFHLELTSLCNKTVQAMLGPDEEERFEEWARSETEVATFFLDSIDELTLTAGSFDQALKNMAKALRRRLDRARIVITTRPVAVDRTLIRLHLPVPKPPAPPPSEQAFAKLMMEDQFGGGIDPDDEAPECQTARKVAPRSASNVDPLSMLHGEEAARRSWSGLRSRAGSGSVVCGELRACS